MGLVKLFAQRIDSDKGYDNLKLAQDLAKIADEYYGSKLQRRIERAWDQGFKDGQQKNPQIQAYLDAKKTEKA